MADYSAGSFSRPDAPTTRPLVRSSIPRSSSSYGHYDTAEPSSIASLPHDTSIDSAVFGRSSPHNPQEPSSVLRSAEHGDQAASHDAHRRRRSHKPRPSGGFLLSNSILDEAPEPDRKHRGDDRRRSRIPVDSRKGKSPLRSSEDTSSSTLADLYAGPGRQDRNRTHSPRMSTSAADLRDDRPQSQMASRRRSMLPSLRPSSAPLDADSTRIVSMALELSDSRRQASRRNISSPIPPRLAQLPDTTPGRSLKQHLQQQRRSSRNISPRADRNLSPRVVSAPRIGSPLPPGFDNDGGYQYHFSSSTLNRAQRAKEYIELMAQYRRLLSFLPPLKQEARSRPSTSDPITSPSSTGTPANDLSSAQTRPLGRAYNPLQYIRNRKIRTRERKVIDGEAEGFGEVPMVTGWIDNVVASSATHGTSESPKLPPFPTADECKAQQLPASNLPRPVSALNKPKRPRFDWSIEPADMLADVYWLEQDNNRYLIEDRHYAKIYTPRAEVSQLTTQVAENSRPTLATPALKETPDVDDHGTPGQDVAHATKADAEAMLTGTGDRARRKLRDLRGMHHKHSNSVYSHREFLGFRRGSSSDSSDNESDRRRRGRNGTISASGKDLLEKQMIEMLARESRDEQSQLAAQADATYLKPLPAGIVTPDHTSRTNHREYGRKDSHTEATEHWEKFLPDKLNQTPPIHSGRASLDVPNRPYRSSLDVDSPRPVPSDIALKGHQNGYVPAIGMNLSPSASRPSSPARNPFSKVKSIFRDRSRDRDDRENDDKSFSPIDLPGSMSISAVTEDAIQPLDRLDSTSSTREFISRSTQESHKSHRSMGSLSLRPDEQVGLRTIFKGSTKLDDMIRGGVSKVTDFIWKKDSDSDSSDGDFDTDVRRGRPAGSALLSPISPARHHENRQQAKNYMDIMPSFKSTTASAENPVSHEVDISSMPVLSRPSRSPRFDQLKPPRIDIRKASPELSDLEESNTRSFVDSDTAEFDFHSHDPNYPINKPSQTSKELQGIISTTTHNTGSSVPGAGDSAHVSEYRNWVIPDRASLSPHALVSRREVARLRTLILCSGIKAMEISRRANEPNPLCGLDSTMVGLPWTEICRFVPGEDHNLCVPQTELFPTTARILSHSVDDSLETLDKSVFHFSTETAPALQQRIDTIHNRVAVDFMEMTHHATDEADAVSRDIVDYQRLKVKSVVDTMDKMLRRRRRRFRWVRRAGWLAVEWVLVGFMWYVWFVVMLTRIVMGAGRGVVSVVRWLLWL
ncbi:putative upf0183 domain-containing protein [Rosellinia necatrix]|uniref:Putative upf0183 domain-containing protein n=1 Tax=Rosellinia necatrix TaxID=77044 RepID=A0A1S7ULY6_ROSNE|nr:putative upf0183 domain-containing protein [Rosellinia necatrix]